MMARQRRRRDWQIGNGLLPFLVLRAKKMTAVHPDRWLGVVVELGAGQQARPGDVENVVAEARERQEVDHATPERMPRWAGHDAVEQDVRVTAIRCLLGPMDRRLVTQHHAILALDRGQGR